jgi:site-specific DNA recombinase
MDTLRAYRAGGRCTARYLPAELLENAVWQDVCAVLTNPELIALALERAHGGQWLPQEFQARQKNVRAALRSLETQQARLLEAYLASVIELAELERARADLSRKQQELLVQQRQLEVVGEQQKERSTLASSIEEFCSSVRDGLQHANFRQRRELVELVIDRVIVENENVEIRYAIPTSRDGPKVPFCRLRLNYFLHADARLTNNVWHHSSFCLSQPF